MMLCPHCAQAVFKKSGAKLKARTRILVMHKSGEVEINCSSCGKGVLLPLSQEGEFGEAPLKKAAMPKLVVRRKVDSP